MIGPNTNLLVVSAHAADFVWRGGGTIAKYVNHGANVSLVVLSYGARGESGHLWKIKDQTLDNVREIRHSEIEDAAESLGVTNLEIWDYEDYLMHITPDRINQMVRKIREVQPDYILTHGPTDAFNPDHETVSKLVFEASVLSISQGVKIEGLPPIVQAGIFGFEPHQSEISDFKPDVIIDITDSYEQKKKAMNCFQAQPHLIDYYDAKAKMRGNHARRCSGIQKYQYAEAFSRFFPYVGGGFV